MEFVLNLRPETSDPVRFADVGIHEKRNRSIDRTIY